MLENTEGVIMKKYNPEKHIIQDQSHRALRNHSIFVLPLFVYLLTSGAGTAYPSGAPEFTSGFQWGSCYSIFSFICMFCWKLFVLLYFFCWPRGNQNPYIEEEQTTQWPKEKVQKDKQRSTKHIPAEVHGRHKPTMTERLCYLISCERHLIRTVLHFITMLRRYIIESYRKQAIIINRR